MNCFKAGFTPKQQAAGNKRSALDVAYTNSMQIQTRMTGISLLKLSLSDIRYVSEATFLLYC
jgi:hypothetical protein